MNADNGSSDQHQRGTGRGSDRESQSARGVMDRENMKTRVAQLEAEVAQLKRTIVGLGSLVAQAAMAGYIASQQPEGNDDGISNQGSRG